MYNAYNPYYGYNKINPQFMQQYVPQQQYTTPQQPIGIQGKTVDSLEVVKAMDIPLDGSTSYFPLIDGSAIVTKQLQQDGTSKMVIFKPVDDKEPQIKYVTSEELKSELSKLDNSKELRELRDELKSLRRKMQFFVDDKKEE